MVGVDIQKQLVQKYIQDKKGVKINSVLREGNQRDLILLDIAYKFAKRFYGWGE